MLVRAKTASSGRRLLRSTFVLWLAHAGVRAVPAPIPRQAFLSEFTRFIIGVLAVIASLQAVRRSGLFRSNIFGGWLESPDGPAGLKLSLKGMRPCYR